LRCFSCAPCRERVAWSGTRAGAAEAAAKATAPARLKQPWRLARLPGSQHAAEFGSVAVGDDDELVGGGHGGSDQVLLPDEEIDVL
jgi:hypothetical protein